MHAATNLMPATPGAKLLAVVSAVLFWCVPFSPFVAIAAVKATENSKGWPRHVAKTAGILTVAWVALLMVVAAWMVYVIVWNPARA